MFQFLKNSLINLNIKKMAKNNPEMIINFIFRSIEGFYDGREKDLNNLLDGYHNNHIEWIETIKNEKSKSNFKQTNYPFIISNRMQQFLFLYFLFGKPNIDMESLEKCSWVCSSRKFIQSKNKSYEILTIQEIIDENKCSYATISFQLGSEYQEYDYNHIDDQLVIQGKKGILLIDLGFYS